MMVLSEGQASGNY